MCESFPFCSLRNWRCDIDITVLETFEVTRPRQRLGIQAAAKFPENGSNDLEIHAADILAVDFLIGAVVARPSDQRSAARAFDGHCLPADGKDGNSSSGVCFPIDQQPVLQSSWQTHLQATDLHQNPEPRNIK